MPTSTSLESDTSGLRGRPALSRYYRSIWRTHRLHHFKNEHYWHGITNTISDRALGTFPEQREVERSRTARDLDAGLA